MVTLEKIHGSSLYGWAFFVLRKDTFIKNGILKFGEKTERSHVQYRGVVNRKDDEFTVADFT
jgi:hypothetical protein